MEQHQGPSTSSVTSVRVPRGELVATVVLWLTIVIIHAACGAYYAFVAILYHALPTTLVGDHMRAFRLTLDLDRFPILVGIFGFFSLAHAVLFVQMLLQSARHRKLFFHSRVIKIRGALVKVGSLKKIMSSRLGLANLFTPLSTLVAVSRRTSSAKESFRRVEKLASHAWERSFGATGLFGVGGRHFAVVFLIREAVEAVLQSIQAYNLSKYVPRAWLNRSAVAIVAASCWSTPVIRRLLSKSPRMELILCLFVDIVLDMVSSIGVPVALGLMYFPDYDPAMRDFNVLRWFDNAWIANLDSELKQLFVQSWLDLSTRVLFAVAMLLSLDDVKLLATPSTDISSEMVRASASQSAIVRLGRRAEKVVHAALILWGFVILALHLESATGEADLTDCMVRVRPWLVAKPTCAAMEIDCKKHTGMVGLAAELEARWVPFDARALTMLIVRNCEEIHMPASIQSFQQLTGLSLYFSNVVEWTASAALTKKSHPNMRQILLGFLNMTDACAANSSLPSGLLSRDFPPSLGAVVVAGTAFNKLPSDLHDIWPRGMSLRLMGNGYTALPDEVLRLDPVRLNLQYNVLKSVPATLFELPSLQWLELGFNAPLAEFPEDVEPSKTLLELTFQATNVSSLPTWMRAEAFLNRVRVSAPTTPLCAQIQATTETKALATRICSSF